MLIENYISNKCTALFNLRQKIDSLKEEIGKLKDTMDKCDRDFEEQRKTFIDNLRKINLSGEVITDFNEDSYHHKFLYFLRKKMNSTEYDAVRVCSDYNDAHFGITGITCNLNSFNIITLKTQEDYKAAFDIVYKKYSDLGYYK